MYSRPHAIGHRPRWRRVRITREAPERFEPCRKRWPVRGTAALMLAEPPKIHPEHEWPARLRFALAPLPRSRQSSKRCLQGIVKSEIQPERLEPREQRRVPLGVRRFLPDTFLERRHDR